MLTKDTLFLSSNDSLQLYVSPIKHKRWIVVTHGLGEHALRHKWLFELFQDTYNICLYDLRGHGASEGKQADIDTFSDYVNDLEEVLQYLKKQYKMSEYSLFGHSMGGLIVATFLRSFSFDIYPKSVFLSSPAVGGAGLGRLLGLLPQNILSYIASLPLHFKLKGLLNIKKLSHNPAVYQEYLKDTNVHMAISIHLLLQIIAQAKITFSTPWDTRFKTFVVVGTEDFLVNADASIHYFTHYSENVELLSVKGSYHELHNEIEVYKTKYFLFLKNAFELST